jgi:hypothetical protein
LLVVLIQSDMVVLRNTISYSFVILLFLFLSDKTSISNKLVKILEPGNNSVFSAVTVIYVNICNYYVNIICYTWLYIIIDYTLSMYNLLYIIDYIIDILLLQIWYYFVLLIAFIKSERKFLNILTLTHITIFSDRHFFLLKGNVYLFPAARRIYFIISIVQICW